MLETSHRDGTRDAPSEGDLYGNGVPIVVVGVTTYQGGREGRPQVRPKRLIIFCHV
jgi:hypothetical protein